MAYYAVFQYGSRILGVGATTVEAINDAKERMIQHNIHEEKFSLILGRVCMAAFGDILLLQCSKAVYESVRATGAANYEIVEGIVVLPEET